MKKPYLSLFILLVMASILCAGHSAQFEMVELKNKVEPIISRSLVLIDASVTDKNGNPVQGLKAEDFKLSQDGRQQEITEFHEIERATDGTEPRTIIFVIDDLGLPGKKFNQVRTAIRNFTDTVMHPTDKVAIARTAGGGVVFQPLTSDASELRTSISRWQWSIEAGRPAQNVLLATSTSSAAFIQSCAGST
ncbi:MAG: VWA domain-containing protein [Acidobacteria bacterium]|nr:VWA domain-containing protein [Acidobacteriota bacterium]